MGVALAWGYWRFEGSIPRGPSEFAAWPPLDPLPFAPLRGFSYEQLARHGGRLFFLAPAALLLGWTLARFAGPSWEKVARSKALPWTILALGFLTSAWLCLGLLQGRALLDDELVYVQQAELLSRGQLAETDVPRWAAETFTIWTDVGATGKYLFGEPLVQVPGVMVGNPALMHLPLLLLTLWAWWKQVDLDAGGKEALWAVSALAISPLVMFTTATGLSHATSLACVVLGGLGVTWLIRGEREIAGALLAGNAFGFAASVRVQTAVPVGAVLVLFALVSLFKRRRFGPAVLMVGCGLFWGGVLATYNWMLTGSALRLPWSLYRPLERYGFGQVLEGDDYVHSVWTAIENLAVSAVRFNAWWLGLPLGLGVVAVWFALGRPLARSMTMQLWSAAGLALVIFHVPYYSTGVSETGPIYLYELILPLSLMVAGVAVAALEKWPRATVAMVFVHLVLGTSWFTVENAQRIDRELAFVHGPAEMILEQVTPPALLLFETAPQENVRLGWINGGFPKRWRHPHAPVVTYPRGNAETAGALRSHYSDRSCWYYRVDPARMQPTVLRCEDAEVLMARPERLPGPPLGIASTAVRKKLLDPFADRSDSSDSR